MHKLFVIAKMLNYIDKESLNKNKFIGEIVRCKEREYEWVLRDCVFKGGKGANDLH